MEILALRTSVSSILLILVSTIILRTDPGLSLPLSAEKTSEDNRSEDSVGDVDAICNSQYPVSKLKQLSLYSTDCKSNDKDFWIKNCRCSHEVNCHPPKCPQEMTTSTAKTVLPTTTLLSSVLLSSLSSTGTTPSSTTRHLPTNLVTTFANLTVSSTISSSSNIISTSKSHEELPTPSKFMVTSNTNFIRLG